MPGFDINIIWVLLKLFFLFGIGLYIVFAGVVIKQVNLMTETVHLPLEPTLKTIAWIHLIFSLAVFLLALLIL